MSVFENTVSIKTSTKAAKVKSVKTNPINTVILPHISPSNNTVPEVEKIFVSEHETEAVHDVVPALESEAKSPVPESETATPKAPRVRKVIPIKYMKLISFTFNVLANFISITPDEAYDILVSTFRLEEDIETIMKSAFAKMNDEEMLKNTKVFLKTKKAEHIKAAKDAEKAAAKAQAKIVKDAEKAASLTTKLVEKADEVEAVVAVDQENREANPEVKKTLRKAKNVASKALENTLVYPQVTDAVTVETVASPKPVTKRFKKAAPAPIQTENLEVVEPVVESVFVPTTLKEQDQKLDEKKSVAKNLQASRAASAKKPRKGAAAATTATAAVTDELNADAEV